MAGGRLNEEVEQAIRDLFEEQANKSEYVSIDHAMERLDAHADARVDIAQAMKCVAAWNSWEWAEGFGDAVSVLPRTDL